MTSMAARPRPTPSAAPARPASSTGPHLRPRGSRQGGVRQFNERVVLQAIRLHGALPAAELARLTHLTAQTISLITKRLLEDDLLRKGEPQRGRVGQPSVPLALNPDGAYAVGIKIGRRSVDTLLVDFTGTVRQRWSMSYRHPDPEPLLAEIGQRLGDIRQALSPALRDRVQGVGIARPLSLGGWKTLLGMPPSVAQRWSVTDFRARVEALTAWPVQVAKDTAAACVAELVAGHGRGTPSFLYVFVDTFIGGGLVLESKLFAGIHGNAGAIGSMPLALGTAHGEPPEQLLGVASLRNLEQLYEDHGLPIDAVADERALQAPFAPLTQQWLAEAGRAIAFAADNAACLLDLDCVIVDGSFSRSLQSALVDAIETAMSGYSWEGAHRPRIVAGSVGSDARALGGALLPLYANFAPDRDLFLKLAVD
jgi:predicted NBD/HSP70 family sugar kinase